MEVVEGKTKKTRGGSETGGDGRAGDVFSREAL
jgi:hypothetical protein